MKKIIAIILLAAAFVAPAFATYTKQNVRIPRVQIETTFTNGTTTATSVNVTAFGENVVVNDSDAADVIGRGQNWRSVSFDMLNASIASTNITAAAKTVTYTQLAALIRQACLDQANLQGITLIDTRLPRNWLNLALARLPR